MNWNFFSHVYILNQKERTDRWDQCEDEMERVGIFRYFQFYSAEIKPEFLSFCISQHQMLSKFVQENKEGTLLILEDDCIFPNLSTLDASLQSLPEDFDFVYLGCNLKGVRPAQYSEYLSIPRTAWMSHAIGYSYKYAQYIVENYDPLKGQMFDDWLGSQLSLSPKAFVTKPMVAFQRPGKSDLWNCMTDYTSTITQGNELL